MPLLIDVNNVLHVVGVLPPELAGIDLEELGELVADSRYRREDVVFVCDGKPRRHRTTTDVKVLFSGAGVSADDVIIRLVGRSTAPRRLTVVSSDREIATNVRRRRAKTISAESFLATLAEDARAAARPARSRSHSTDRHPADHRQVEHWMRLFGVEGDPEASPPTSPPERAMDAKTSRDASRPGRSGVRIDRATRLADIDPRDLDALDMERLLDDGR